MWQGTTRGAAEGRATNYGFSTSWQQARMVEVGGLPSGRLVDVLDTSGTGVEAAGQQTAAGPDGGAFQD